MSETNACDSRSSQRGVPTFPQFLGLFYPTEFNNGRVAKEEFDANLRIRDTAMAAAEKKFEGATKALEKAKVAKSALEIAMLLPDANKSRSAATRHDPGYSKAFDRAKFDRKIRLFELEVSRAETAMDEARLGKAGEREAFRSQ